MRVNWLVPLKGLYRHVMRVLYVVDQAIGFVIYIVAFPVMLMGLGVRRIARKARERMKITDHELTDVDFTGQYAIATQDVGTETILFVEYHFDVRITKKNEIVLIDELGRTYLVKELNKRQEIGPLSEVLAEGFLFPSVKTCSEK